MKKTTLLFVAAVMTVCLMSLSAAGVQVDEWATRHLDRGIAAVEAAESPKDFLVAVEELRSAVKLSPDWPEAHLALGKVLAAANKPAEAAREMNRYLELLPGAPDKEAVTGEIRKLDETRALSKKIGLSGMTFASLKDGVYVLRVLPGSKVEKAGLQQGDRITSVNGSEVAGMTLHDFLALVQKSAPEGIGKPLTVTVFRAEEPNNVVLSPDLFKVGCYEIEDAEFEEEVLQSKVPVAVIFLGAWSTDCLEFVPVVEEAAKASAGKVKFVYMNSRANAEWPRRFIVHASPTTMFFRDGKAVASLTGSKPEELKQALADIESLKGAPEQFAHLASRSLFPDTGRLEPIGATFRATDEGVLLSAVGRDSPADKAGMTMGDIVVRAGGQDMRGASAQDFLAAIDGPPGAKVTLDVTRQGAKYRFVIVRTAPTGPAMTGWKGQASRAAKMFINDTVARSVLAMFHPSGEDVSLKSLAVDADGAGLAVTMTIAWKGNIVGTPYTSVVRWRFNSTDHVGSEIPSDTGPMKADARKLAAVDDYLRRTVLPQIRAQIPDEGD